MWVFGGGGVHGSQKDSTNVVNLGREEASGNLICVIIFFYLVSTLGKPKTSVFCLEVVHFLLLMLLLLHQPLRGPVLLSFSLVRALRL